MSKEIKINVQVEENEQPIIVETPQYFAPVQSVNGKIGFVTITQSDLGISGGYASSGDLLNYAKVQDLTNYSGYVNSINSSIVFTTGAQDINDTKTFIKDINVSGTGNFNSLIVDKIDVLNLSGIDINIINGKVLISGDRPTINGTGVLLIGEATQTDLSSTVRTTGDQTISGTKNFNTRPQVNTTGVILSGEAYPINNPSGFINSSGNNNFYADLYIFSGADVLISGGTFNSNVRYAVNGTGVVLSGESINNLYIIEATTSQTNMNSSNNNYFNYQGAGYTSNINGRLRTALDNFTIKKVNLALQQATLPTNSGVNGTLTFFNQTKNIQSPLISNINTTGDNSYYEWMATNLNIPVSFGDKWAFNFSGFALGPSNIRSVVDIYCYL